MSAIIHLVGRLGDDPELSGDGDRERCSFSVCNNAWNGKGEEKIANWYSCTAWGKRGETIAKHFTKGSIISLHGELVVNEVTNEEGKTKAYHNVMVQGFEFTGSAKQPAGEAVSSDDIPF